MSENVNEIIANTPQELYLHWRAVAEDFDIDHMPEKRGRLQKNVQEYFNSRNIPTRSISRVVNNQEGNYIILEIWESLLFFDIYSEQFCGTNLIEANEFRELNPSPEVQIILDWVPVLQELMNQNYNDSYIWGFLNNRDAVDFQTPELFQNMTARELQMTLRGNIHIFESKGWLLWIDESQRNRIIELYRSYLEIVMWIGDRYEEGSDFYHKTEQEIDLYLRSTVYSFSSFRDSVDYYIHIQTEIYENGRNSKSNKQAYRIFSQKLWVLIFERFQREFNQNEETSRTNDLLRQVTYFMNVLTERSDIDINNDLRNPRLAEEICIFILWRENGVLDTLENCTRYRLDFSDSEVWKRTPTQVINETENRLRTSGFSNPRVFLRGNFGIDNSLIVGTENTTYEDLSLDHKRQISILARLIKKIDEWDLSPDTLSEMDSSEVQQYIVELWQEITREAYDAVREAYDRNFDSDTYAGRSIYIPPDFVWTLEDIGVNEVDIDTLRLFNDIRWHDVRWWDGFMNFSDENLNVAWSLARSAWIIIWTIAVVMLATAATWWLALPALAKIWIGQALIASGGWLTMAGSLTSIGVGASLGTAANMGIFDPRSHDSLWEALWDIWSDFAINTFHAIYMERLTMQLWNQTWNLWRAGLLGWDLWGWVGIEVVREHMINRVFHWEPLLWDIHSTTIKESFFWIHYDRIQESLNPEIEARFQSASHIYYLWTGEQINVFNQNDFWVVDWSSDIDIMRALEGWILIQENRI
jgi:hypothetical protein